MSNADKGFLDYLRNKVIEEVGELDHLRVYYRPPRWGDLAVVGLQFGGAGARYGGTADVGTDTMPFQDLYAAATDKVLELARKALKVSRAD